MDCSNIASTRFCCSPPSCCSFPLPFPKSNSCLCSLPVAQKPCKQAGSKPHDCAAHRARSMMSVHCQSGAIAATRHEDLSANFFAEDDRTSSSSSSVAALYKEAHNSSSAHEALEKIITGQKNLHLSEKELALRKLLKERRGIVQELLIEALRASKLGPIYSKNVVSSMPEFIDHVMIEAAALKKKREHVNASFSFRARVYIEQSGVAKAIKWLKHHSFTAPKIGKLVFWVEDYEGVLQPKIRWLKSINVTGKDLGAALTREPCILEQTLEELNYSVTILQNHGVKKEWIGWIVRRSPKVLACKKEELQERMSLFSRLGIEADDFGKMVYNFPASIGHFSLDEMQGKLDYLKGFGLDDHSLGKVLASKPQLIACSIEDDWKPLIKLLYYLGVDGYGLRRILCVQPSVFCLSLVDNIAPKIRFLRAVGVQEEAVGSLIVKFPPLLSYSLDLKIRPLVKFLLEVAGVPADKVGKVLSLQPDLIARSVPNRLEIVVKFFLFHGIQKQEIGAMVADFPMLLKYSLSILKPKFKYTIYVMERPLKEVVNFPRLFSYSLQSRIAPRHKMLSKKGLHFDLKAMLACSDEEFLSRLDIACGTTEDCKAQKTYHSEIALENG